MDVEIRTIAEDEFEEFLRAIVLSFSGVVTAEDLTRERLVAEIDRCLVAVDDGRMVGGAMAVTLPRDRARRRAGPSGGRDERRRPADAPPTRDQLVDHARAAGRHPFAGRVRSPCCTRPRAASTGASATAWRRSSARSTWRATGRRSSAGTGPPGACCCSHGAEAMPLMRQVYDRAQPRRPGMIAMDDAWWELLHFEDEQGEGRPDVLRRARHGRRRPTRTRPTA